MSQGKANDARRSLRRHAMIGLTVIIALLGGMTAWAVTTELAGAVTAPGILVVDSNVKKVQHPTGGVVKELHTRNGARVKQGDIVMRLDDTLTRANHAVVVKSLAETAVRQARLEAERDGAESVAFPDHLLAQTDDPGIAAPLVSERKLFEFRRAGRAGQKAQLAERIAQLQQEAQGLAGQAKAKESEIKLIAHELEAVRTLWKKKLIPISRATALEREAVRLEGERNQLLAAEAQAKGKITETELQILQIDQDLRTEVARELREVQAKTAELVERRVAAEDQLSRTDIRAPQDGVVHQLEVHTVGGVVSTAEPLMLIVPGTDALIVEARIPPDQIDRVSAGQKASLRFAAFNQQTTPEISGTTVLVSADISTDPRSGVQYYVARVAPSLDQLAEIRGAKLVPGMPVDVFIQTEARTVMSYLGKPLMDHFAKAFRER